MGDSIPKIPYTGVHPIDTGTVNNKEVGCM
jgi:hypothetical protein